MKARGRWPSLGTGLAILAVFALPAAAQAKPGYEVKPPRFSVGFSVRGSHGFNLSVTATRHRRVTLTASKGLMSTSYTVPGRATRRRIEADFGDFGKVSVRFDGSPGTKARRAKPRRACRGRPAIRERGTFRGTIRFRGEHGYTSANARRARGSFHRSFRRICKKKASKSKSPSRERLLLVGRRTGLRLLVNMLIAESRVGGRRTSLAIVQLKVIGAPRRAGTGSLSFVLAGQEERTGRVAISRSFFTLGDESSLLVGDPGIQPPAATVALPKPFSGTASYREEAGLPPIWTGDLGVWLPGAGVVPLTGEGFTAGLCQALGIRKANACLRRFDQSFGEVSKAS